MQGNRRTFKGARPAAFVALRYIRGTAIVATEKQRNISFVATPYIRFWLISDFLFTKNHLVGSYFIDKYLL